MADATALGLTEFEMEREADNFRDYWTSAPGQRGVKLDWNATWRRWCRSYRDRRNPFLTPAKPLTQHQLAQQKKDEIVAKLERFANGSEFDFGDLAGDIGPATTARTQIEGRRALGSPAYPVVPHYDAAE